MPEALACPKCGAPITPNPHDVRVRCTHCGSTVEITSEGALHVAEALARVGIRIPDHVMSVEDIEEKIATRERERRAATRTALIVTFSVIFFLVIVVAIVLASQG